MKQENDKKRLKWDTYSTAMMMRKKHDLQHKYETFVRLMTSPDTQLRIGEISYAKDVASWEQFEKFLLNNRETLSASVQYIKTNNAPLPYRFVINIGKMLIPEISSHPDFKRWLRVLTFFLLIHEVGHCLFTPYDLDMLCSKIHRATYSTVIQQEHTLNRYEDGRIHFLLESTYPNLRNYIAYGRRVVQAFIKGNRKDTLAFCASESIPVTDKELELLVLNTTSPIGKDFFKDATIMCKQIYFELNLIGHKTKIVNLNPLKNAIADACSGFTNDNSTADDRQLAFVTKMYRYLTSWVTKLKLSETEDQYIHNMTLVSLAHTAIFDVALKTASNPDSMAFGIAKLQKNYAIPYSDMSETKAKNAMKKTAKTIQTIDIADEDIGETPTLDQESVESILDKIDSNEVNINTENMFVGGLTTNKKEQIYKATTQSLDFSPKAPFVISHAQQIHDLIKEFLIPGAPGIIHRQRRGTLSIKEVIRCQFNNISPIRNVFSQAKTQRSFIGKLPAIHILLDTSTSMNRQYNSKSALQICADAAQAIIYGVMAFPSVDFSFCTFSNSTIVHHNLNTPVTKISNGTQYQIERGGTRASHIETAMLQVAHRHKQNLYIILSDGMFDNPQKKNQSINNILHPIGAHLIFCHLVGGKPDIVSDPFRRDVILQQPDGFFIVMRNALHQWLQSITLHSA